MALILVVDDEELLRRTLRTALERAGHEVEEAVDGGDAVRKFARRPCELVLIDIIMPEREGVETIGELRRLYPELPIIAMSGGGSVGGELFLDLARRLGATRTLPKPIRNAELVQLVAECLETDRQPGLSAD